VGTPSHRNVLSYANANSLRIAEFDAGAYGSAFSGEDGNPNAAEIIYQNPNGKQNIDNPTVVRIADLDGDGIQEILLGRYNGQLHAFYRFNPNANLGYGDWISINFLNSCENASSAPLTGLSVYDLDGDGRVEILISNDYPDATGNNTLTEKVIIIDGLETIPFSGGENYMDITPTATMTPTPTMSFTPTMTPTESSSSINHWKLN